MISAQFTVKLCIGPRNREKFTKAPCFGGSRSFKGIDVGTGKLVSSACYDKQHVCVYLQPSGVAKEGGAQGRPPPQSPGKK